MRLGVYVGSFNPVHIGHIKIVNELIDKNILDKVIIIATQGYWNKQNLLDLNKRIEMLKFFESDKIIIDEEYNNYKYTYEILNELNKNNINDDLYLIVGADQLPKFHLWKHYKDILKYNILVINRNKIDTSMYTKNLGKFIILNDIDEIDVSSTMIRNDKKLRKKYLDYRVNKYIEDNDLY